MLIKDDYHCDECVRSITRNRFRHENNTLVFLTDGDKAEYTTSENEYKLILKQLTSVNLPTEEGDRQ
jgi:hypothetical protein